MGEVQEAKNLALLAAPQDMRLFVYARKKTERMTTALYLVTELLPESEPLRWELRKACMSLLRTLSPLIPRAVRSDEILSIKGGVAELESLIEIARSTKLFSNMNADLLCKTCGDITSLCTEMDDGLELKPDMLDAGTLSDIKLSDTVQKRTSYRTSLYDTNMSDRNKKRTVSKNAVEKRRERIIDLLRERGTATVSDIKEVVSGVSGKTLQRDLGELVEEGILGRKGRRRWTTYSLI